MLKIYGHPFASLYWRVLIAIHERKVALKFLMGDLDHPQNAAAIADLSPTGQFPVLVDGERSPD